jgi:hypothetical protein
VHILHPFDRRDLSAELGEIRAPMVRIEVESAAEAGQLSQLVMEISNALVDLGMLPIQNIHHLPKSIQEAQASDPVHGTQLGSAPMLMAVGYLPHHLLLLLSLVSWSSYNIHINIYIYNGKLVPLDPCVPSPQPQ